MPRTSEQEGTTAIMPTLPLPSSHPPSPAAGYATTASPLAIPPATIKTLFGDIPLPPIESPFIVVVDSQEQFPFTFHDLRCDASRSYCPIHVRTDTRRLGDWSQGEYRSMGDYSIEGFIGAVSIERKSMDDLHGTVLGWEVRRPRFERELDTLNQMQFAAVVIECSLTAALAGCQQWGVKTADENRRALFGSIQSWQQKYNRVHWNFCDTRRLAEETTWDHLRRFWERKVREGRRQYGSRFMRGRII